MKKTTLTIILLILKTSCNPRQKPKFTLQVVEGLRNES